MRPELQNPHTLLDPVIKLALVASEKIIEIYNTDFTVTQKDDCSPLTEADMAAHHIIVQGLQELTPELPVLSEEAECIPFAQRAMWQYYWLVDPLDGTREFIKRNGEFTVNIALIAGQQSVLGVICVPVTGVCYFASAKHGAYKQLPQNEPMRIHVRSCSGEQCTVVGSRSHRDNSLDDFIAKVGECEVLNVGSSLKSCLVAEGKADIYPRLGPTYEWDTAAAQCIVEEAGGRITDIHMQPLCYNTKESLLNPHFFAFGDVDQDWARFLPTIE